ncbi:MAG: hypothetical protein JXQ66_04870 [Campylobacterales bacterium]|nr:hypothetical protein [Campylobacterales bacterium]
MYKNYILSLVIIFFTACSTTPTPHKPNEKVFEAEDRFIVFALRAEELREHKVASEYFTILYEKSDKKEYLYRSLQNSLEAGDYEKILTCECKDASDVVVKRMKVIALVKLARLEEAELKALELVSSSKKVDDYLLVGDIYVLQKEFDTALKYLEGAYVKEYNEKILDKISIILYVNLQRKKEAIAQLETHSMIHGCSHRICGRLISFYSDSNDVDGLLSVYLRYYKLEKNDEVAKKIVQIYTYKKEFVKLINFLEENGNDDELLLDLYVRSQNYDKSHILAYKLYQKYGDIEYLGQSAIYEYENFKDNLNGSNLSSIISKFEDVVAREDNALYLNYYGYLLIDHNIDVKKGIKLIKKALEVYPESSFYLDSLAWGYYKLGECKKAKSIMDKVSALKGGDEAEIVSHIKEIDRCIKNNKGK